MRWDRLLFAVSALLLLVGGAFVYGLYSGYSRNSVFKIARDLRNEIQVVTDEFSQDSKFYQFLQPARGPGERVTVNEVPDDGKLILMTGLFDEEVQLRLIRRDGSVVAKWSARFSEHFPDRDLVSSDLHTDLHGVVIEPNGDIVFNYEYFGTVKLSRCGDVLWTLKHPTHHSLEFAEAGGYWILGRVVTNDRTKFPPFTELTGRNEFQEDLILRVSEDGKILEEKSIPGILYENGMETIMTATGYPFAKGKEWPTELVHTNKISELPSAYAEAFSQFEAGDLVLSLRQYNLLVVVDPDTWKVKWHQTGPWRRQHDPEFNPDGTITMFNNNTYRMSLDKTLRGSLDTPRVSNIMRVDPKTGATEVAYGMQEGEEFLTIVRGKHDLVPGGGFFISEFEGGRVFEVDANRKIVWEYINRFDEDNVAEVTEGRLYPASYFDVTDWNCP